MRKNSDTWFCILCGRESSDIVCHGCSLKEKERQRQLPGSVTMRQVNYIVHLLSRANCEFDGDLHELNVEDAGQLICNLIGWVESGGEKPPGVKICETKPCAACGKQIRAIKGFDYCRECYRSVFQCHAKTKKGEQCRNRVSVPNGFCRFHSNFTKKVNEQNEY